jgi:3-isopropylmalate dehydrogenase
MLLRYSFADREAAQKIEQAVRKALAAGYRTADLHQPGTRRVGTEEMGEAVLAAL